MSPAIQSEISRRSNRLEPVQKIGFFGLTAIVIGLAGAAGSSQDFPVIENIFKVMVETGGITFLLSMIYYNLAHSGKSKKKFNSKDIRGI